MGGMQLAFVRCVSFTNIKLYTFLDSFVIKRIDIALSVLTKLLTMRVLRCRS